MTFKSGLSLWSLCNKCVTSCFFGKFFGHELREIYCSGGLKPATGDWAILLIADDAVPAAERLKNVAPGVSPGSPCRGDAEPRKGRKIWVFRPSGAEFNANTNPGLAPVGGHRPPLQKIRVIRGSDFGCGFAALRLCVFVFKGLWLCPDALRGRPTAFC